MECNSAVGTDGSGVNSMASPSDSVQVTGARRIDGKAGGRSARYAGGPSVRRDTRLPIRFSETRSSPATCCKPIDPAVGSVSLGDTGDGHAYRGNSGQPCEERPTGGAEHAVDRFGVRRKAPRALGSGPSARDLCDLRPAGSTEAFGRFRCAGPPPRVRVRS